MTNATVKRGRGYEGLDAWKVENPDGQRFIPGRTIMVLPAHEEAPAWRAILAGFDTNGYAYVVPLAGHFGELRVRKCIGAMSGGFGLSTDEPSRGDECDWAEAKCLALSVAHAFNLTGIDH
jgi:hypothetical protein